LVLTITTFRASALAFSALALSVASPAVADTLPSLDRATFQAAAPALTLQDFDSFADQWVLTFDGQVTYGSSTGTPLVTSTFLTSTSPNGLGRTGVGYFLDSDVATFTFLNPITAFGIDINTFASTDGSYDVLLNTGDQAFSIFETFPGTGTGQFIGFVSDTPFTTVSLSANTGFAYTLDTLLYGSRAAVEGVPEPATWAMMVLGFGLVGGAMRQARRRRVILSPA
jgi:hypothetical protein